MAKVSVIIAVYNSENTIEKSIRSICGQTFADWECLICDDGSDDSTWEKINELVGKNEKFVLLKNKTNLGIAVALNRCINLSSGEYIAIQDADDFSEPERIEEQVEFLENHLDVTVVGSYAHLFYKNGIKWGELKPPENPTKSDWLQGFFVIHASALMRKKDIIDSGRYDARYKRVQDHDLWLNLITKNYKIVTMPKLLYNVSWDIDDYSRRTLRNRLIETKIIFKGIKQLNIPSISYLYLIKSLLSGIMPRRILLLYHYLKFRKNFFTNRSRNGKNNP